jgi:hypothetical protein
VIPRISLGLLVRRSFRFPGNPILQCRNLIGFEWLALRWHPCGRIRRHDTIHQQTRPGITGDDRGTRLTTLDGQQRRIEPQAAFLPESTVTGNAAFDEDWFDVPAVIDMFVGKERRREQK